MIARIKSILFGSLPNDASKYYDGTGAFSTPSSGSDWTTELEQLLDQDVENSTTVVDSTDLILPVTAESVWYVRGDIAYGGTNAADDFKFDLSLSAGSMRAMFRYISISTANAAQGTTGLFINGVTATTALSCGIEAGIGNLSKIMFELDGKFTANANLRFRFAQAAAGGAGTFARLKAGSMMRGKRFV